MTPSMLVSEIEHIFFHTVTADAHKAAIRAVEAYTAEQLARDHAALAERFYASNREIARLEAERDEMTKALEGISRDVTNDGYETRSLIRDLLKAHGEGAAANESVG